MSLTASPTPERGRRGLGARLLSLLVTVIALGLGAWFVLRRRSPALPRFVEEAQPGGASSDGSASSRETGPTPESTSTPQPQPPPQPVQEPDPLTGSPAPDGVAELLEVQGIGRRSAQALADAGVDSLARLAEADDATLVAALEAAGLRRSPTLSSWASQARRLLRG